MAKETHKVEPEGADAPADKPLSIDDITDRALGGFTSKSKEGISRQDVRAVVATLDLAKLRSTRKVPRLMIRRLRFNGTKRIDSVETPIDYDQPFETGVNALVIEDNLVGKSSVLKTIKFALTGNDDEYDQEVRQWIKEIWLEFSLDDRVFTILLARREDGIHGRLAPGTHTCALDKVPRASASKGFYHRGAEDVQKALESFFVHEFGLASLGWNQALAGGEGKSIDARASWLTYFQALRILDDNHAYLLCKPEFANQDQLLFSAFLGLHLSEPLNQLSIQAATLRKTKEFSAEQVRQAAERRSTLVERRQQLQQQIADLDAEQARRLNVLTSGNLSAQLVTAEGQLVEGNAEITQIEEQIQQLNSQMQQNTATARRLREQIDLSKELTGLQVSLCPNCAQKIDPQAVDREKETHQCRLCVRPVPNADQDAGAVLEATAKQFDQRARESKTQITRANRERDQAYARLDELQATAQTLRTTVKEGFTQGLPTPEEAVRRGKLHEEIGEINHEIKALDRTPAESQEDHEKKGKIIEKVQAVLKKEAEERNKEIEQRLNELATEVIWALRADCISGIKCYPTGLVKLTKNDENISFSKIMNPGERYRAKLALFLAMMRLGCEAGVGRHPGFLLLDQLGAAEMVPEDLQKAAAALRKVEQEFSDRVQIICFTAKPEFREATVPTKVYGHRIISKGKKCAF